MRARKPVGQGAASRKYDLLTAIGAWACAGSRSDQRLALRLMTLITARYNWQSDELRIGRAQIAQLWQVDERTVKRDMGKLRSRGWLWIKVPAARGRVAVYGLDWDRVLDETTPAWGHVGADFADRLTAEAAPAVRAAQPNVVAFPGTGAQDAPSAWDRTRQALAAEDPAFCAAWLDGLTWGGCDGVQACLVAPSNFHAQYLRTHGTERIVAALRRLMPSLGTVRIDGPGSPR